MNYNDQKRVRVWFITHAYLERLYYKELSLPMDDYLQLPNKNLS